MKKKKIALLSARLSFIAVCVFLVGAIYHNDWLSVGAIWSYSILITAAYLLEFT